MELNLLFQSVIDQDTAPVVICDLDHTIVYMNPAAAANYAKYGGEALVGRSLLDCHNETSRDHIRRVVAWFRQDPSHNIIHTFYSEKDNKDVYMVALRGAANELIGYYEKHEYRNRETQPLYEGLD
jgi:PAS domain-containing protein